VSVLNDILVAVKARLDAVTPALPTTVVRKKLVILPEDTLPMLIIGLTEGERVKNEFFGGIYYEYPVGVCLVEAGNREYVTGRDTSIALRERIRDALILRRSGNPLGSVSAVWDIDVALGSPLVIPISGTGSNYQASNVRLKVTTSEERPA
jgi:hypothetical protein